VSRRASSRPAWRRRASRRACAGQAPR
jgi:hypothetical protein